jgi:hypothetical protein
MTRPAIIIGLGGTGQWVVTYVKKNLLEGNKGKVPSNIRLLAFDTMPEASVKRDTAARNDVSIGSVSLEVNREFFGLSGNSQALGDQVVRGQAPHIGRWFDAEFYRQQNSPAIWDLASGAGQVRQFGRLALFMKIDDVIWNEIRKAYLDVKTEVTRGNELEVLVVASFAGGTGAGMFVDTGIVCRSLASTVNNNLTIRGFFVLPRVFSQGGQLGLIESHTLARSFAAWRELDRFMNIGPDYGAPRVVYKPNDNNLAIQLKDTPFDQCYLVDSRRQSHSLENTAPEYGVFPAVADFISTLTDVEAGTVYTLDVTNRAAVAQAQVGTTIGYTALGTWTVRVPIYYALQEYAYSFAKELLDTWLIPVRDQNKNLTGVALNQNREAGLGTRRGKDEAVDFLQNPTGVEVRVGEVNNAPTSAGAATRTILNTPFLQRVGEIYQKQLKNNAQNIINDANGGHTLLLDGAVNPGTYIGTFAVLPQDASETKIFYDNREQEVDLTVMQSELEANVWDAAPPSRELNEPPTEAPNRFRLDIEKFEKTHFGTGGGRGNFGTMLDKARLFQVGRFRQMLHQWTLNTLNGSRGDAENRRSGKLGYANDFFQELVKISDYFISYIEAVIEKRGQDQRRNTAQQIVDAARQAMVEHAGDKCVFLFTHPRAHITQREFLQAVDDYQTIIKDDMLLASFAQTGRELKAAAQEMENATRAWIDALVIGTANSLGAYHRLENDLGNILATRRADQNTGDTQFLLNLKQYREVCDHQDIVSALERFQWEVNSQNGFRIDLLAKVPVERKDEDETITYEDVERPLSLRDRALDHDQNLDALTRIGLYYYRDEPAKHRAIEEVMRMREPQYSRPEVFGSALLEHSQPLLELSATAAHSNLIKFDYLRMRTTGFGGDQVADYKNNLEIWLKEHSRLPSGNNMRVVESENEHEITFIQQIDNVQNADFVIWGELRQAYMRHILSGTHMENAARLHIFPAEVNAARYESKIPRLLQHLNKPVRIFHPRVVMLLEDISKASLFFRCYAYGFIKGKKGDHGERWYYLDLPARSGHLAQSMELTQKVDRENHYRQVWPTPFEVMNNFVNLGHDVTNPQNAIIWEDLRNSIFIIEKELREQQTLDDQLKKVITEGFVRDLRQESMRQRQIFKQNNPQLAENATVLMWQSGQEYEDLADLAEMMYREVLTNEDPIMR